MARKARKPASGGKVVAPHAQMGSRAQYFAAPWRQLAGEVGAFCGEHRALLALSALFAVICFGYEITHFTLSIDEEFMLRQLDNHEAGLWVSQGRWGISLLKSAVMKFGMNPPFYATLLAVIFTWATALLLAFAMDRAAGGKCGTFPLLLFAAGFMAVPAVSYSYLMFNTYNVEITCGMAVTALAAAISAPCFSRGRFDAAHFAASAVLLTLGLSFYQSFVTLYITAVVVCCFAFLVEREGVFEWKPLLRSLAEPIAVSVTAFVCYGVINKLLQLVLIRTDGMRQNNAYLEQFSRWGKDSVRDILGSIVYQIRVLWGPNVPGIWILALGVVVLGGAAVLYCLFVRRVKALLLLPLAGVLAGSPFLLFLYLGGGAPLRSMQGLMVLAGGTWALAALLVRRVPTKLLSLGVGVLAAVCLLRQAQTLNYLFYWDHQRYEHDCYQAAQMMERVRQLGGQEGTPLLFVGQYSRGKNDLQKLRVPYSFETFNTSYFTLGQTEEVRLLFFLEHCGYAAASAKEMAAGLPADKKQALYETLTAMPDWPAPGSVAPFEGMAIIKFSRPSLGWLESMGIETLALPAPEVDTGASYAQPIQQYLEKAAYENGELLVEGWGFIPGVESGQSEAYVVLQSAEKQYVLPADFVLRDDILNIYGPLYSASGYRLKAALPLDSGTYQVGLYLKNPGAESFAFGGVELAVP